MTEREKDARVESGSQEPERGINEERCEKDCTLPRDGQRTTQPAPNPNGGGSAAIERGGGGSSPPDGARDDSQATEGSANPQSRLAPTAPGDPFDLSRLRLSQDFADQIGVKKALITVPVCKPKRQWFVRVHPDPAYRLELAVLELKEEREIYLVDPALLSKLPGEVVPKILFTAINRQGVVFLWPVRLPDPNGRHDEWSRSALEAAQMATKCWVRVVANMSLGAYEVFEASADIPEPMWPEVCFKSLLEIAFRDLFIRTLDHPVIKRLQGEL